MLGGVWKITTAVLLTLSLAACAENAPSLEANSGGAPARMPAPAITQVNPAVDLATDQYRLGAGDKIRILVFSETELSGEFVVGSSGAVDMPLIGAVDAQGATVREFQER